IEQLGGSTVAVGDELLVEIPAVKRLLQCKDVLRAVVTGKRSFDELVACLASMVAKLGERLGISFARYDGAQDCQARLPRDVADDLMELQVHERERLLHAPDLVGRTV